MNFFNLIIPLCGVILKIGKTYNYNKRKMYFENGQLYV